MKFCSWIWRKNCFQLVVSNIFYFHPCLGKIPMLTSILQMGGSTTNYFFLRFSRRSLVNFPHPTHPSSEEKANGSALWQFRGILPGCDARWAFILWMGCRSSTFDGGNPANQLRLVVYPIIDRVFYSPCGAVFLCLKLLRQQKSNANQPIPLPRNQWLTCLW